MKDRLVFFNGDLFCGGEIIDRIDFRFLFLKAKMENLYLYIVI